MKYKIPSKSKKVEMPLNIPLKSQMTPFWFLIHLTKKQIQGKKAKHQMQPSSNPQVPICYVSMSSVLVTPVVTMTHKHCECFGSPWCEILPPFHPWRLSSKLNNLSLNNQSQSPAHTYNQFILWTRITCDLYLFYTALYEQLIALQMCIC